MNALSRILARFTFLRWMALAGLMLGVASQALATKTYSDNGDGTVTDPITGLQWMRCSMGQTWNGTTSACTGTASYYTWDQAEALTNTVSFAGHSDWSLPNIRELQTIVDRTVYNPAIDDVAFSNTPPWTFWSASVYAGNSNLAWYVYFFNGVANSSHKLNTYSVRLVRAGQPLGPLLNPARLSRYYVDNGDGTVTHRPTGLMWQRCAVGQSWSGSTCSVAAGTSYTWAAATGLTSSFAGHSDWRLPTQEELLSVVDYSLYSPTINTTRFPNTPTSYFWSGSLLAYDSSSAWAVDFYHGIADHSNKVNNAYQVRFVRTTAVVTGKPVDLTPILMLLLD